MFAIHSHINLLDLCGRINLISNRHVSYSLLTLLTCGTHNVPHSYSNDLSHTEEWVDADSILDATG